MVAVDSGDTHAYLSGISSDNAVAPDYLQIQNLCGWSADSAYLAFTVTEPGPTPSSLISPIEYIDLVKGTIKTVPFPPDLLTPPPPGDSTPAATPEDTDQPGQSPPSGSLQFAGTMNAAWAPGANLLAFTAMAEFSGAAHTRALCLFDPSSETTRVLVNDNRFLFLNGWLDNSHLLYRVGKDSFVYDLNSNQVGPAPASKPLARTAASQPGALTIVSAPASQQLLISANQQPVTAESQAYGNATAIWVQRKGGLTAMNRLLVDVFRGPAALAWNPDADSHSQFAPNGGFDRQGRYQVAYIAQGDLKVCDLSVRSATLMEKAVAGEKLPCNQEQLLALQNARQVGLAILQYTQDFDERFPAADGFATGIAPYLPQDVPIDLPNIANFQYTPPADLALGDAASPADTALGEYSLPCGTVTLYMDGHVKVIPTSSPAEH